MISFCTKAGYSSGAHQIYWVSGMSTLLPGLCSSDPLQETVVRRTRSKMDYIQTSKQVYFAGDKTCQHRQITAKFHSSVEAIEGFPDLRPASFDAFRLYTMRSYNADWVKPANGEYYTGSEVDGSSKVYATPPSCQYQIGETKRPQYLVLPGDNVVYDVVWTYSDVCVRYRWNVSWLTVSDHIIGEIEYYYLTRSSGDVDWTFGAYSATPLSTSWFPSIRTVGCAGIGVSGVDVYGGPVPASRYPGGTFPSFATIKSNLSRGAVDPYRFKALLGTMLGPYPPATTEGPFSVRYGEGFSDQQLDRLNTQLANIPGFCSVLYAGHTTEQEWAELANTCIDGCQAIDINGIAYIKEGIDAIVSVLLLIKRGELPSMVKVSDLWLSLRYGVTLSARDTVSIVEAAKRAKQQARQTFSVTRARRDDSMKVNSTVLTSVERSLRYKLYYNRYRDPVIDVLREIADWDLWPSAANTWDLIPFSFVVDWLVDVQGQLEKLDTAQYEQFLSILSVLYTEKWTYRFDPIFIRLDSWVCDELQMTFYHRRHTPSLHYAPLRFGGGHASNINWVDGAMLILQKKGI